VNCCFISLLEYFTAKVQRNLTVLIWTRGELHLAVVANKRLNFGKLDYYLFFFLEDLLDYGVFQFFSDFFGVCVLLLDAFLF
jgi:hypothetical protein